MPQPEETNYWRPGQVIPTTNVDFHALLSEMQFCIKREFDRLNRAVENISDHLVDIESTWCHN